MHFFQQSVFFDGIAIYRKKNVSPQLLYYHDEISVDYPDCVHPVVEFVLKNEAKFGILICGSAQGVAITANKYQKIRAAVCWEPEIATLARKHNDANILCLPARYISEKTACNIIFNFLQTAFEGGRHKSRIEKITSGLSVDFLNSEY